MYKSEIDVAVLIIFFNRPNVLRQVFEQVKKARPSRLYLYQDGCRNGNVADIENVKKCRDVVSDIDWECEVFAKYQEKNYGCDPSEYIAQKWMFETEEKGIILEDDDVPSISFFSFCKELLDKYENDERIYMISGMNHLGKYENEEKDSYLFTRNFSIWGWATWKRVIDEWDPLCEWINNDNIVRNVMESYDTKRCARYLVGTTKMHLKTGREHYESISEACLRTSSRLCIVPRINMISNIGLTDDATHTKMKLKQFPKNYQKAFYQPTYELEGKLKHPQYVLEDFEYKRHVNKMLYRTDNWFDTFALRIEIRIRRLLFK